MAGGNDGDIQAYLARIRKTIEESERLVSQAALRVAETDRMLEKQGLTREQVMAMRFTDAQVDAVNAELRRRGLDPLDDEVLHQDEVLRPGDGAPEPPRTLSEEQSSDNDLAERQRKFGMMMKPFQI